jgi:hypothetical protein
VFRCREKTFSVRLGFGQGPYLTPSRLWGANRATLAEPCAAVLPDPYEQRVRFHRADLDVASAGERVVISLSGCSIDRMAGCLMQNHVSRIAPPS